MDTIDKANEAAELFQQQALKRRKPEPPAPTGFCLNCGDPLEEKLSHWCGMDGTQTRWCDLDCKHDWEKRRR